MSWATHPGPSRRRCGRRFFTFLALKTISTNPVHRRIGIPDPFTPIAGMAFDVIAEYDPQRAAGYRQIAGFRLERLDGHLAHPIARHHLDCLAHQLGRRIVLVRPDAETGDDLGCADLPHSHLRGRHPFHALDRAASGRKAALAVRRSRDLCGGGPDAGRYLVHLVGSNPSRAFLVQRDHAQGGSSCHRHRPVRTGAPPDLYRA